MAPKKKGQTMSLSDFASMVETEGNYIDLFVLV